MVDLSAGYRLLTDTDTTGTYIDITSSGEYQLAAAGTFDGATLGLSFRVPPDTTDITVTDNAGVALSLTGAGVRTVKLSKGEKLRGTVSGAGASTSVNMWLLKVA